MITSTDTIIAEAIRTRGRRFLGLAALAALAMGSSACCSETDADAAVTETDVPASSTAPAQDSTGVGHSTEVDRPASSGIDPEGGAAPEIATAGIGSEEEVGRPAEPPARSGHWPGCPRRLHPVRRIDGPAVVRSRRQLLDHAGRP